MELFKSIKLVTQTLNDHHNRPHCRHNQADKAVVVGVPEFLQPVFHFLHVLLMLFVVVLQGGDELLVVVFQGGGELLVVVLQGGGELEFEFLENLE